MISKRIDILKALSLTLPALLGDIELDMGGGIDAVIASICLATSIIFLGAVVGLLTRQFLNISMKGGIMMKKVNYKDHLVICGWSYQCKDIIDKLLSGDICSNKQIVVLSNIEKIPYNSDRVDFIEGSPLKKEDLIRAGVSHASSIIIVTDIQSDKWHNLDAKALMITTYIKQSLKSEAHVSVQLLSSENRELLEMAGADEVVCLDEVGGGLLAFSTEYHSISKIINELLTFNKGSELYRFRREIPYKYIGKSFTEVGKQLMDKKRILIAVETKKDDEVTNECSNDWLHSSGKGKVMIINPQGNYKMRKDDSLFVIAEKEPVEL